MQVIRKEIEYGRADKFTFYPIGDMHTGVIHCDEDLLKETVSEINHNPKAIWLGMGDYADLITPGDFRRWEGKILAPWMKGAEDNIGPTQLERVDEILSPIWNKCLGLIDGNHDDEIRRAHHYNFMGELLKKANRKHEVPHAGVSCFLELIFRRKGSAEAHSFIIHARHGEGAARTSGARSMAVLRLSQSMVNAHVTLMGHLHGQESPDRPQGLLLQRGKIKSFESIATMTGAWLRAYMQDVPPCYLERWGCPKIIFEPNKQSMTLVKTRKIGNI